MRQFVPERRLPVERARFPRARRVERDDAPEAGAEGAEHARQPERPDREVVVAREDLHDKRALRRERVARREVRHGGLDDRQCVHLQNRRLVRVQAHQRVPHLERLERLERVEHPEQVEGDVVVGIGAERQIEHAPRLGLVAGPQQVHAQIRVGAVVVGLELDRLPRQRHRVVEPVVPGGQAAGRAVDVAVDRIDRQRAPRLRLEVGGPPLDVRHRRQEGARLKTARRDLQGARDVRAGLVRPVGVDRQLGLDQHGVHQLIVDVEREVGLDGGGGRVALGEHPREPGVRRRPSLVGRDRLAIRALGVGLLVLLEEQVPPGGVDGRAVGRERERLAEERVGRAHLPERPRGPRPAREFLSGAERARVADDARQRAAPLGLAPEPHLQQPELERGLARREPRGQGREPAERLVVTAVAQRDARQHGRRRRIVGAPRAREPDRLVLAALGQRGHRRAREPLFVAERRPLRRSDGHLLRLAGDASTITTMADRTAGRRRDRRAKRRRGSPRAWSIRRFL